MKQMPISPAQLDAWSKAYQVDSGRQLATMSLSRNQLSEVAYRTVGEMKMRQKFSLEIKTLPVTNQKHSGRCWLFAATNVLRERIAKELDLEYASTCGLPYHAGAAKYFAEKGITVDTGK